MIDEKKHSYRGFKIGRLSESESALITEGGEFITIAGPQVVHVKSDERLLVGLHNEIERMRLALIEGPKEAYISLNTASALRLQDVLHIDAYRASEIERRRPFDSIDGLVDIPGIGPARIEEIKQENRLRL